MVKKSDKKRERKAWDDARAAHAVMLMAALAPRRGRVLWRRSYDAHAHAYVVPAFGIIGDGLCDRSRLFDVRVWRDEGPRCAACLRELLGAIGPLTLVELSAAVWS